jgi:RimJ/RimL family protein N-acetyltransferase
VFTADEGRRFIERQWQRAERGTGYSFAIAEAGTGEAIGQIGLWLDGPGPARVGYWVAEPARGRGAAGHALAAVAAWALGELGLPRLELYVEPWNEASVRTAERAGFRTEGLLRAGLGGKDLVRYSLLPADLTRLPARLPWPSRRRGRLARSQA